MARLDFYDGSQFDDTREPGRLDPGTPEDTSSPTKQPSPSLPTTDPTIPTYDPSSITINVRGSTPDLQISSDGTVVLQNTPGFFQISFKSILENGIRVKASKTGFNSPYYYIVSTYWIEDQRTVSDDNLDDTREPERIDEISFRRPGILIEKFDQNGNRVNTERLQTDDYRHIVDIFFEMTSVIEPSPQPQVSLGIFSITGDDRIVGTPNDRNDIFSISVFNDELNIERFTEGAYIDGFDNKNEDVIINIESPEFEIVEYRIYKSTGGRDWEQHQLIKTVNDQDELQLTVNDELVVEVEYKLSDSVIPIDDKPKVNINQSSFIYNINDEVPPSFEVELLRGDGIRVQVSDRSFDVNVNEITNTGRVEFEKSDFNALGQFRVFIIPYDSLGDGILQEVIVNVVQEPIQRIAQLTEINYPSIIEGADYNGYDTDFEISWKSVQTDFVDVYIGDNHVSFGEFNSSATINLNVNSLITKYGLQVSETAASFTFPIRLVPKLNNEAGIEEQIDIQFIKSRVQLPTDLVQDNMFDAIINALDMQLLDINNSKLLTHIVNIEGTDFNIISNWQRDDVTFTEFVTDPQTGNELPKDGIVNSTLVLKLFEPLPTSIQPNTQLWISKLKSVPYIDRVVIKEESADTCIKLAPANFNVSPTKGNMGYEMFDDIIGLDSAVSSQELINRYVGKLGIDTTKLDIIYAIDDDYQFHNFVHFGSAEEQSLNFLYKIDLLESYNNRIDPLVSGSITSGSIQPYPPSIQREITQVEEKIQTIISGLNGFETYLYNSEDDTAYPKDGNGELIPHNISTTPNATTNNFSANPIIETWFDNLKNQSIKYDKNNENLLTNENNIPRHILRDNDNEDFLLFLEMIGHHFDIIWSYTNEITSKNKIEHKKNTGIVDNLVYHMLESFGWDVDSSIATQQLWQAAFGEIGEDNTTHNVVTQDTPGTEYQNQIWRRILNNLPYLLKHKGTKRSVQAMMAAYGIPQSMLTIMEFGGTRDDDINTTQFTFEDRSVSIKTKENEYIEVVWNEYNGSYPNAIELRVKPSNKEEYVVINNDTNDWTLTVTPTQTGSFATIEFEINNNGSPTSLTTNPFPFYNDEYTQILINRITEGGDEIYTVDVAQGFNERIRAHVTGSLTVPTGSTGWESGSLLEIGNGFVGNIDEIRLWTIALDEDRFFNHTLSPDSIDGNELFSYNEDLLVRFDFEYPKDREIETEIKNVAPNVNYTLSGSAVGFTGESDYPFHHEVYERSVTANIPSVGFAYANKTRIEEKWPDGLSLSHQSRVTKPSHDRVSVDTNQLGLYFSPMKEVNLDIIKSFGDFRIDDYIGDPSYEFKSNYSSLEKLRHQYFANLNLNIYEYIQLIRYIDKSLFDMLENILPARAKTSKGLLIEPHLFNRSKVQWKKPEANDNVKNSEINILDNIDENAEDLALDVEFDVNDDTKIDLIDLSHEGIIEEAIDEHLDADYNNLIGLVTPIETDEQTAEYLTYIAEILTEIGTADVTAVHISDNITEIGVNGDENPSNGGFGLYTKNGFTERITFNNGNLHREKIYAEVIKDCNIVEVGVDIDGNPEFEERCSFKLNFQPAEQFSPTTGAEQVNGYLPSHFRYVSDRSTGLIRSYYEGSKNSSNTTLDGSPAVETFITNPNTLRVSDQGRGSGEPILEVT